MPTAASPEQLIEVVQALVTQALEQAKNGPDDIERLIDDALGQGADAVKQIEKIPGDALDELHRLTHPPDWFTIAAFALVQIAKLDPHLSVGAEAEDTYAKALTLTYTDPSQVNISATIVLALFGDKPSAVKIRTKDAIDLPFAGPAFSFHLHADGAVEWVVPLAGPIAPPAVPVDPPVTVTLKGSLDALARDLSPTPGLTLTTGALHAEVALSTKEPLWSMAAGLGTPGAVKGRGIHAAISGQQLLGPLAGVLSTDLPDESYSPSVTYAKGSSPAFDLGHESKQVV
jgi:hypothetical protein